MTDNTNSQMNGRESHEAKSQAFRDKIEEQKKRLTGKADNKPSSGGAGTTPPQGNGGNGNSNGGETPDTGHNPPPPSQPNAPTEEYSESTVGISSAYDMGKMGKDEKAPPAKTHGAPAKAPEHKKNGYKPGESKDFLQVCYNEIVVAAYAGAIDFTVDLTLDIFDYILFAPLGNSKSAEKKKNKKDKTVYDYADEIIKENNEKGKNLIKSFLLHHKELMDNIELAQNGQRPRWRIWQGEKPQCFDHLVEIKNKADADPNSPEAKEWEDFKNLPQGAVAAIATEKNMANYAVHHAALTTNMAEVDPIPVEVTKAFNNMEKLVENPQINDNDLKNKISTEIANARPYLTANTPVNREFTEKLNEFAQTLLDPNCNREAIAVKIVELRQIHPIKHKLKEKAAALGHEIKQNLEKIDLAYAGNPEQAKVAKEEYLKKVHESQKEAALRMEKDANANFVKRRVGIGKFGRTKEKAKNAIDYAENTMRHVNVQQNNQNSQSNQSQQPKKRIENDASIRGFINQMGMGS